MRLGPAIALAAVAVAAGCGGDDDAALSTAEYRKQGNALCVKARLEAEKIPQPKSPDGLADYLEKTFDRAFEVNEEFEALNPPEELRDDHQESIRQSDALRERFDAVVDEVRRSDDPSKTVLTELNKLNPELKEGEKLSRRLGLDECLQIGPPSRRPDES